MIEERILAGHRVLRLLAEGSRSQVWLAPDDIVLKALRPPIEHGRLESEVSALHRAAGEHVIELLDVSQSAEQSVLVFPRLPRASLAELLSGRAGLDAGEAVTVLAPLAACLARIHACGVSHRALTPAAVLFRADGAPMLTGFGSAALFEPGLPEVALEVQPGVADDRAALARIADAVLSRVTGSRSREAGQLAASLRAADPAQVCERLGTELFELAAARPVDFTRAPDHLPVAARVVPADPVVAVRIAPEGDAPPAPEAWWRVAMEAGPIASALAVVTARWAAWSPGRRKLVIGGMAAAAVAIAASATAPGLPTATAPTATAEPVAEQPETAVAPPIGEDDPLAALGALLDRRDECLRDLSVLCLDGVDEQDSQALDTDRDAISAISDGGVEPPEITAAGAVLTERLGGSALVALAADSDPASVLLVKGEAGWRIRDYLAAAAG